jgi:hypothetical protein
VNYLGQLTTRALLGTSRGAGELPSHFGLAELAGGVPTSPEAEILRAAGAYCLYERAGRLALRKEIAAIAWPDDTRPQCSKRASAILDRVLTINDAEMLIEWLKACVRAGRRPPASILPALLDAATRRIESRAILRSPTATAVGPTGLWLCRLNPDWSALVAEDASVDVQQVWQTGNKPERVAALSRLRMSNPAAARELLNSTFATEPAADRAAFLDSLAVGLSSSDEAFLETALSDRSKEVRTGASKLLSRLAGSAFVSRMIARVTPLLTFAPAEPGKFLRKGKPAQLSIELPAACDESMKRDGIEAKPNVGARYGERQYWLLQMLSLIAPMHWSKAFAATPMQLLVAIPDDYTDLIQMAWSNATFNTCDPDWAEAFVRLGKHSRMNEHLIKLLPDGRRLEVIYDLISADGATSESILEFVASGPLDVRSTRLLIKRIAERARGLKANYNHELAALLPRLALAAPPEVLSEFESAWPIELFESAKKAYEQFFITLTLRQNIQKEFA